MTPKSESGREATDAKASEVSASPGTGAPGQVAERSDSGRERVLLHMPVDVRNLALSVIAVIASAFMLQWAKAVFIPILIGVMSSYALTPIVNRLHRWRVPRALGAGLLLSSIVAAIGWGAWSLSDDATALVETLPQAAQKLRQSLQGQPQRPARTIAKMQQAAAEIERAAEDSSTAASSAASGAAASNPAFGAPTPAPSDGFAAASHGARSRNGAFETRPVEPMSAELPATPRGVTRVLIEKPRLDIKEYLWTGTLGAFGFLGQLAVVFFITFFLLALGDSFRRKMVKLAGPRLSQKKITVQALDDIAAQIERYLLVQVAVSLLVGVATWLAFVLIGLQHAAVWGVVAGVTNLIPYLGAVIVSGASALVGFIQFGAIDMALVVGASSFAIHTLVGNLLTPWWMGRAGRMSPFVVFVSVLAFGWLWGIWGLLLGVPIVMVVKSICDRIDELKPIGELLGD